MQLLYVSGFGRSSSVFFCPDLMNCWSSFSLVAVNQCNDITPDEVEETEGQRDERNGQST